MKTRDYIYSILLYTRAINFFIKLLLSEFAKEDFVVDTKIHIVVNSILFLLNKIIIFIDLILSFFKLILKESEILMNVTDDTKSIDIEYKENFIGLADKLKSFMKKINCLFDFDLNFHFKMVKITRFDNNESKIVLSFNDNYISETKKSSFMNIGEKVNLFDSIIGEAINLKKCFGILFISVMKKLNDEVDIFKTQGFEIRNKKSNEDNGHLLKIKSDQIEIRRRELNENLEKVISFLPKINNIFKINSWEFLKSKSSYIFYNLVYDKTFNE